MARGEITERTHFGGPTQTKLNASVPPNEPISTAKRLAAFGERRTDGVEGSWKQCRLGPLACGRPPGRPLRPDRDMPCGSKSAARGLPTLPDLEYFKLTRYLRTRPALREELTMTRIVLGFAAAASAAS